MHEDRQELAEDSKELRRRIKFFLLVQSWYHAH